MSKSDDEKLGKIDHGRQTPADGLGKRHPTDDKQRIIKEEGSLITSRKDNDEPIPPRRS